MTINIKKSVFIIELKNYIENGEDLRAQAILPVISEEEFNEIELKYDYWFDEVKQFLKSRIDDEDNEVFDSFRKAGVINIESINKIFRGQSLRGFPNNKNEFNLKIEAKIRELRALSNKVKFFKEIETEEIASIENLKSKVFISHSSQDKEIVGELIDLLESINVKSENIFCSSFEGYGIELGENFLEVIKNNINQNVLVLFVLSQNFYNSPICLCEMGAAWIKSNKCIPILIPPFDFKDVKGVIPLTQGMKINDKHKLNALKQTAERLFHITPINPSIWERKRDKFIKVLNK